MAPRPPWTGRSRATLAEEGSRRFSFLRSGITFTVSLLEAGMTGKTAAQLVQEARQRVENLTVDQVAREVQAGDALLVDIREPGEAQQDGVIPGAVAAPRGMLEFWADPSSPYHRQIGRAHV